MENEYVYIVQRGVAYEGGDVLGIYRNKEKAIKVARKFTDGLFKETKKGAMIIWDNSAYWVAVEKHMVL